MRRIFSLMKNIADYSAICVLVSWRLMPMGVHKVKFIWEVIGNVILSLFLKVANFNPSENRSEFIKFALKYL